jgi:hypothetical protein
MSLGAFGARVLPYVIPTLAGLGTAKATYDQTGGDLGKALMAGGAAGAVTGFAPSLGKRAAAFGEGRLFGQIPFGPITKNLSAYRALAPGIATGVIGFGGAPLAANLASALTPGSRKAGDALRGSMELLGAGQQLTTPEATGEVNLAGPPSLGQYGPDTYMDVAALNSAARGQMLRGEMEARSQLEQMKTLMPYQYEMITKAANADLARQAAGAQLRTRLGQGAQAMLQAQLGAQALAQQGNQAMLQAATMRGGYV